MQDSNDRTTSTLIAAASRFSVEAEPALTRSRPNGPLIAAAILVVVGLTTWLVARQPESPPSNPAPAVTLVVG